MLSVSQIIEEKDRFIEGLQKKHFTELHLLDDAIEEDKLRKSLQLKLDSLLAESNAAAKKVGELMKAGQQEEAQKFKSISQNNKLEEQELKSELKAAEDRLLDILYQIPNIPHQSVPQGKLPEDNVETFLHKIEVNLPENALPHWELSKKFNLIDFELGVKIAGAGFPVYLGKGARLQRALVQYFLDFNTSKGYLEINPPHVVNAESGLGTGQLPDKEGQMYHVPIDGLYLIPTAEVPVTNIYRDTIIESKNFPICLTAFSQCYRREAGSYGSDVRGLNRLHQFEKVEIVRIEHPERSYQALEEMVEHVKELLTSLELPFRILKLCGGDMSFTSALTFDFEVYSAAQKKWLEVSSVSNFENFQANRLRCRYREGGDKPKLVHTLNGSALALPRIMAAILENYQYEDGIKIPKILHPYTGFTSI